LVAPNLGVVAIYRCYSFNNWQALDTILIYSCSETLAQIVVASKEQ